jgi:hypothetical protein
MIAGTDRPVSKSRSSAKAAVRSRRRATARHYPIILILSLFVFLGALYSVVDPVFEASDELNHYPFVQHLAQGGALPVQRRGQATLWGQEGSQPPLYYAAAAVLTRWIDTRDLPDLLYLNPHANRGVPGAHDNKNMIIHTDREDFPWRGTTLAVHLIRLLSVLLGAGTVFCTYRIALDLFPEQPAIANGAAAVNAFIPMFLFISASVNNDNLVIFLSALALLMMVRLLVRPAFISSRLYLMALGVVLGLACLSKLSALGLLPLAALALAWVRTAKARSGRQPTGRQESRPDGRRPGQHGFLAWVTDCLIVFVPVAVIGGWWYLRNWQLYGDPTGMSAMLAVAGHRKVPAGLATLLDEFQGFRMNFWGILGGVNVLAAPGWLYQVMDYLTIVAMAGLIFRVAKAWWLKQVTPSWPALVLLFLWVVIEMAALIRWTSLAAASQGRLLFPALPALCLFFVLGLTAWVPLRFRPQAILAGSGLLFCLALAVPFTAIVPAYPRPDLLDEGAIPPSAHHSDLVFGDSIRLLAYEVDRDAVRPGGTLGVTLYLQATKPISQDLSLSLSLLSAGQKTLASLDTYPSGGAYPTHLWTPGKVVRDHYVLDVDGQAAGPTVAWLLFGVYRLASLTQLHPMDAHGKTVEFPQLARLQVTTPTTTLVPAHDLDADFGPQLHLSGYDLPGERLQPGGKLPLKLYWQVRGKVDKDYKVFLHLLDERGEMAGQGDAEPFGGFYPTSQWQPGEVLDMGLAVELKQNLAPGSYKLIAGLYNPQTGERVPILDAQGNPTSQQVEITTLRYP